MESMQRMRYGLGDAARGCGRYGADHRCDKRRGGVCKAARRQPGTYLIVATTISGTGCSWTGAGGYCSMQAVGSLEGTIDFNSLSQLRRRRRLLTSDKWAGGRFGFGRRVGR